MEPDPPFHTCPNRIWGTGQSLFGFVVAIACLWRAFRGIDFTTLLQVLADASVTCIILSAFLNVVSAFVKCTKVGILVRPIKKLRYRNLFAAEMTSVLIDTIFPLRLHELVRAYILGRSGGISTAFIIGAEFVVKVVEALLLTVALLVLSAMVPIPPWAITSIRMLLAMVWAAATFLVVMVRWPALGALPHQLLENMKIKWVSRIGHMLTKMLEGISQTAVNPTSLAAVLLITLTEWALLAAALWFAAFAIQVHLTPLALLGFMVANHVAFAVPSSTSGSIGIYEATTKMTLVMLFGMQQEKALAVVLIAHCTMLSVGTLGGLVGLRMAHVSLRTLREQSITPH